MVSDCKPLPLLLAPSNRFDEILMDAHFAGARPYTFIAGASPALKNARAWARPNMYNV